MSKSENKAVVVEEQKTEDNPIIELTPPLKEFFEEQVNFLAQRQYNAMYWCVSLVSIKMGDYPTQEEVLSIGAAIAANPDAWCYDRETQDNPNDTQEPGTDTRSVLERTGVSSKVYKMVLDHSKTYLDMNVIIPEFRRQGIPVTKGLDEMYAESLHRGKESASRNKVVNDAAEILRRQKQQAASTDVKPAICE